MKKIVPITLQLCCLLSVSSIALAATPEAFVLDYIDAYKPIAISEMERTGIPASITLAQAIVESKYGRSDLAVQSNNHFGIKCKKGWAGKTHYFKDDDYHNGQLINSCFRGYDDPIYSYFDHSDFLLENPRYQPLFQLPKTDYKKWAKGLQKCGYATASDYANKLIEIIEKYHLYRYDQSITIIQQAYTLSTPVRKEEISNNASSSLTPPKAFKLPNNYGMGRRKSKPVNNVSNPITYEEAVFVGSSAYLFDITPSANE